MVKKQRSKAGDLIKNLLMIVFAVSVVVIFFNLDMVRDGDSMFSRKGQVKLEFTGDLKRKNFTEAEVSRVRSHIKQYGKIMESATVETTVQDSYKKVNDKSQVVYEIHLVMRDGTRITTTARRTTRKGLVSSGLAKLDRDLRIYKQYKKEGKSMKSLINAN